MFGKRHIACSAELCKVFVAYTEFLKKLIRNEAYIQFYCIRVLNVLRLFVRLAIQINDMVLYLKSLTWETDTSLYVVLTTICRARVYSAKLIDL